MNRSPTRRRTTATTSPAGSRSSRRHAPRRSTAWSSRRLRRSTGSGRHPGHRGRSAPADDPYGESKRTFEAALAWYGRAYGLRSVTLRYFNVAGATEALGEDHDPETHLIPNVLRAAEGEASITIFGDDYPTPDGTCIRDYIHVSRPGRRPPQGDRSHRSRRFAYHPTRSSATWGTAAASRSARSSPPPKPWSGGRSHPPSGRAAG